MTTAFDILVQDPKECDETLFTTEYMNGFRKHLETLRTIARENIRDQNVKIVDAYDGAKNKAAYKHPISSPVFVNINIVLKGQQFKYRKINLMGPMYIETQLANNTYIFRSEDNSKLIKKHVYGDRLVKYNGYLRDPLFKMPNDDTDIVEFIQNECVDRVDKSNDLGYSVDNQVDCTDMTLCTHTMSYQYSRPVSSQYRAYF